MSAVLFDAAPCDPALPSSQTNTETASDDAVYARMEALLLRGLDRQYRAEAMRGLEEVAALLVTRHSEFSDTATRSSPMGREPAAH